MSQHDRPARPFAVPSGRARRMLGLGSMATGIAGNMATEGLRQIASGQRPEFRDLLMTPANARRLADQLARMRGAAMKVGQLISMDAGDILPPELAQILSRLRSGADFMPPRQLRQTLNAEWGEGWIKRFSRFDVRPIAAASIGQVHRARTQDGRELAIKVQYPGIARSIDSDVRNVGALIRRSGILPAGLDIEPLLTEACAQLHDEADYIRESEQIFKFQDLLGQQDEFLLPTPHPDLSTRNVLTMSFVPGQPIESLSAEPQVLRDRVATSLMGLLFREIFEFGHVQSDPNFANYRYDLVSDRIALLDFGATRPVPAAVSDGYASLFRDAIAGRDMTGAALSLGLFGQDTQPRHRAMVMHMLDLVFSPMRGSGVYDFGDPELARQLNDAGRAMAAERDFVHVPPIETLYLQRKVGGLYLLATQLGARVDIRALVSRHL